MWQKGQSYEPYVGRWSRLVAPRFLEWLGIADDSRWIDVGCGTGALTASIVASSRPKSVLSIDASEHYLAYARHTIEHPGVTFQVADATRLPGENAAHDAAVSGLVLNFIPEPRAMVEQMARVVRPGGTVAVYVWDYAGKMELMRHFWDAAAALDPAALSLDEGRKFPICNPTPLADLWRATGLTQVETRAVDVATEFRDFDDYWSPFTGGQGPAPAYAMSIDEKNRTALRERLRSSLPASPDGRIALIARAWAVRGTKPA